MLVSSFRSSPTVSPIISLVVLSFGASNFEIGAGLFSLFRFRSVIELGGMGRTEREEDDVTKEADPFKDAKILVARSSHGSAKFNEGLPPRRFLVAASS